MALQFWFGASGAGKSTCVGQEIIQKALENPDINYFMIVPDQFTMQTQKQMVKMHPDGGILNIDVLSFSRLAHRIFEEVGKADRLVLDDTGKCLLLRKIAGREKEKLPVLSAGLKSPGYIQEVKSILSEFMQYGLKPEDVKELAGFAKEKRPLHLKLQDLSYLYEAFLKECEEKFITKEETLDLLCQRLPLARSMKNSVVVFDGFTGFTPIQNKVIAELLCQAKDVYVTLVMDHRYSPYKLLGEEFLFHLSGQTVFSLQKIAQEQGISLKEDVFLMDIPVRRFVDNPTMAHLERNLFREDAVAYDYIPEGLKVVKAANIRQECRMMCAEMFELIETKGYRYRDIAVVTGDMGKYEAPLRQQFEKYDIPYFMDSTKSMLSNPFVAFLRNALAILQYGFRYQDVFRFLRTGFVEFSSEEIDKLENYVRARGIRGFSMWKAPFVYPHKEIKRDSEELDKLNALRERFVLLFQGLEEETNQKNLPAKRWCELLYYFCSEQELQQKLEKFALFFEEKDDLSAAVEYRQIYRLIMDLLDQIANLLGDEMLTMQEFVDILDAGFAEIRVRSLPQGVDLLVIGDNQRTRLKEIKALFFLGVNEGNIPQSSTKGGLISDMEREFLISSGRELAPTPAAQMFMERLYLYMNLTKPSECLYLSYASMEDDGSTLRPAYLIPEIQKLYPKLQINIGNNESPVLSVKDARERMASLLCEYATGTMSEKYQSDLYALYGDLLARKECVIWLRELTDAAFLSYQPEALEKKLAEDLYGKIMECSISSLERFAACHYAHFLSYGLRLVPREEYGFENMDMGNVMHDILQSFGRMLEENGLEWTKVDEEVIEKFAEEATKEISGTYGGAILQDSAKNRYFVMQLKRIMLRTIKTLQQQLRYGTFKPYAFEKEFRRIYNVDYNGHQKGQLLLKGRIDRIDTCLQGEEVFVKVVDYKSGSRKFDMNTLYYGIALQLAVYLGQAVKNLQSVYPDKEIVPAAMLYYRAADPILNTDKVLTIEETETEILKELNNTGAVSARAGIVNALDEEFTKKSLVVPVSKKGEEILLSDSVFDPVVLNQMLDFAQDKVMELANEIMQGKIDIKPVEIKKSNACEFCDYKNVCGFDSKIKGYEKCRPAEIDATVFTEKKEADETCQ